MAILSYPLPLLLLSVLAFLFFSQFRLPFTPIWDPNDQWDALNFPVRMWAGEVPYRDFYERLTPGTAVVHLLFFRLFGLRNWIPNLHIIFLGLGLTWLMVIVSRKVIRESPFLTLLPSMLFLAFAFLPHMEDTHRWYSCLTTLAALAVVMKERTRWRLGAAGFFSGLASFFTQTQGVVAVMGLGAFLLWEVLTRRGQRKDSLQQWACLLGAWAATVLASDAYFIGKAGLGRFIDCVVRIPVLYLSSVDRANTWHVYLSEMPHLPHWYSLPSLGLFLFIYPCVPFVYIISLLSFPRQVVGHEEKKARLVLLNFTGLSLFAGVALAPSNFRLCSVSPPAFIALICLVCEYERLRRIAAAALAVAALYFLVNYPLRHQALSPLYLDLPQGRMAFLPRSVTEYELMRWLSARTRPGEPFLTTHGGYFLYPLALRQVGEAFGYTNTRATRPEWVQNAVAALSRFRVRFVAWPPAETDPKFYIPQEDSLSPLKDYVMKNYHLVKRTGGDEANGPEEIWERNP
jgi:hypothetical protein